MFKFTMKNFIVINYIELGHAGLSGIRDGKKLIIFSEWYSYIINKLLLEIIIIKRNYILNYIII